MAVTKNLCWLTSYPKSGNTWMRILLSNYLSGLQRPVDLNALPVGQLCITRNAWEDAIGVDSADFSWAEVDQLRPAAYTVINTRMTKPFFFKSHDLFRSVAGGQLLFPAEATRGVLYMVRNPLDVAISFAHHLGVTPQRGLEILADEQFMLAGPSCTSIAHPLGSWSSHVGGWLGQQQLPMLVVAYEDLLADPCRVFAEVVQFWNLPVTPERIQKAVEFSTFERLREQESRTGFRERPADNVPFFRRGKAGSWQEELSCQEVDQIIDQHGTWMQALGYLDSGGKPLLNRENKSLCR